MKSCKIARTDLAVSCIAYGGDSLGGAWDKELQSSGSISCAARAIRTAYDNGITLFDNADIYAYGKSEAAFGSVLKQSSSFREKIVIQSKCGIHLSYPLSEPPLDDPHHFDFSYDHIVSAVEGSLRRLNTDRLDILLLHRPDALMEPDEVARAFDRLHTCGKVRYFGVSNHTPAQIEILRQSVRQPIVINQLRLGLAYPHLITDGLDANRYDGIRLTMGYTGVAGTLDYCRLNGIQIQAFSPVRGLLGPAADDSPAIARTMRMLGDMAVKKNVTPITLAIAWLLRHPAGIVPVIGSTKPEHIVDNCAANRVDLSRQEWYRLLLSSSGLVPTKIL